MMGVHRRRWAAQRKCWICHRRNVEQGQRGPRQAHGYCRKLVDHGVSVEQVRRAQQGAS